MKSLNDTYGVLPKGSTSRVGSRHTHGQLNMLQNVLPIYRGLFSPNNSRKTPIAMGVFREFGRVTEALKSELRCFVRYRVIYHRDISRAYSSAYTNTYSAAVVRVAWA